MDFADTYNTILNEVFGITSKVGKKMLDQFNMLKKYYISKETEESLEDKYKTKIKPRMEEGRDFSDICDDKDILIGGVDQDYIYRKYVCEHTITLQQWRESEIKREMSKQLVSYILQERFLR